MRGVRITSSIDDVQPLAKPQRVNSPRCADCPHYRLSWCTILARRVERHYEMCRYGRQKHASAQVQRSKGKGKGK